MRTFENQETMMSGIAEHVWKEKGKIWTFQNDAKVTENFTGKSVERRRLITKTYLSRKQQ